MSVLQPPALMRFVELFDRANSSSLGSDWFTLSGTASSRIVSNAAQQRTQSSGSGRNGCWQAYQGGLNRGRFLTDNYGVRAQMKSPAALAQDNISGLVLAIPETFSSSTYMVHFSFGTGSSEANSASGIVTVQNAIASPYAGTGQSGQTDRISGAGGLTVNSLISLERRRNVFTAYVNGALKWTWTDTGNIVPFGSGHRRWGFFTEGNNPFFPANDYSSPAFDWIEAYDIAV